MRIIRTIRFRLNGEPVEVHVEPNELLINVLREKLHVTDAKYTCGIGECGSCTVLVDGEPILSCITLAVDIDGREVITSSGFSKSGLTHVEQAFIEEGAIQCGYCLPGFVVMGHYIVQKYPNVSEEELRKLLRGNLCRCTGYINIIRALKVAIKRYREESSEEQMRTDTAYSFNSSQHYSP